MTDAAPDVRGCSRRLGLCPTTTAGEKAARAAVVKGYIDHCTSLIEISDIHSEAPSARPIPAFLIALRARRVPEFSKEPRTRKIPGFSI